MGEKQLTIYSKGLCCRSVCTNMTDLSEIEAEVNRQSSTGIPSKWKLAEEPFRDGSANPCPCEQNEGFQHLLMVC